MKKTKEEAVCAAIRTYGGPVLESGAFREASGQKHHIRSSVMDHSLNVCITGVRLCGVLQRLHVPVCTRDVVRASLCHDLGMLGRAEMYQNRSDAWRNHPQESVLAAREILPDLNRNTEESIAAHMWPLAGRPIPSREGAVVAAADKYASLVDLGSAVFRRTYRKRLKQSILQAGGSVSEQRGFSKKD